MNRADILEWLRKKISDSEQALRAREQAERIWRSGDDKAWAKVGNHMGKAARLEEAALQGRIAAKCRIDLEMLNAIRCALEADQLSACQAPREEACP